MSIQWNSLDAKTKAAILGGDTELIDKLAPKAPTEKLYGMPKSKPNGKPAKNRSVSKKVDRSLQAWILISLISIPAYTLQVIGFIIGAIGDGIWYVAQRIHEYKWTIT